MSLNSLYVASALRVLAIATLVAFALMGACDTSNPEINWGSSD